MKALVVCCLFLLCSSWAAAESLRVGLDPSQPPLQYRQDGRIVGLEPDNATAVARILGRNLQVLAMPSESLLAALEAGKIDVIMSGLRVGSVQGRSVVFTEPYLQAGQMAILHQDKAGLFAQRWSVYREGLRVGVEAGSAGEAFAARELPDAELTVFVDIEQAFAALRQDRLDLFIHDASTSWRLASEPRYADLVSQNHYLNEEFFAWAVRDDEAGLLSQLNQALNLMRSNGTLSYIRDRWIPVQVDLQP